MKLQKAFSILSIVCVFAMALASCKRDAEPKNADQTSTTTTTTSTTTTTTTNSTTTPYRDVFGFFGPQWFVDYTLKQSCGNAPANRSVGDSAGNTHRAADNGSGERITINLLSFSDEVQNLIKEYMQTHPEENICLDSTVHASSNPGYQPTLNAALNSDAVDIYAAEAAYVLSYSKGRYEDMALPYENLITNFDSKLEAAQIAPYMKQLGSNSQGKVVALGYQSTGCCFIYRRSLAKKIFGSDDPEVIAQKIGADTGNFDKFFEAAAECKKHNVSILSSLGDLYRMVEPSSTSPWVNENYDIDLDSSRKAFFDYAKTFWDNGWVNNEKDWNDDWYFDMKGMNGSYGDWAVCLAPVSSYWGGTWIFASAHLNDTGNEAKKAAVAKIIEYITLNTTNQGCLYKWANGSLTNGIKFSVPSAVVMNAVDGSSELCGGQNIFELFVQSDQKASGLLQTLFDEEINNEWKKQAVLYATGKKTKDAAIQDFKDEMVSYGLICVE